MSSDTISTVLSTTAYRAFEYGDYRKLLDAAREVPFSVHMATATNATSKRSIVEISRMPSPPALASAPRAYLDEKVRMGSAIRPPSRYPMHLHVDNELKQLKSISNLQDLLLEYKPDTAGETPWTNIAECRIPDSSHFSSPVRKADRFIFLRANPQAGQGIDSASTLTEGITYRSRLAAAFASARVVRATELTDFGTIQWKRHPTTCSGDVDVHASAYFSIDHLLPGLDQSSPHVKVFSEQMKRIQAHGLSDIMIVDVCELEAPFKRPGMVFDHLLMSARKAEKFRWLRCNGLENSTTGEFCGSPYCQTTLDAAAKRTPRLSVAGRRTGVDGAPVLHFIDKAKSDMSLPLHTVSGDEGSKIQSEIQYLCENVSDNKGYESL